MKESILNRLNNIFYRNSDGFKTHRYKKNNVFSFFRVIIIVILFFAFGCKARKQLVIKPVTVDTVSKPADTKYLKLNAIRFAQTNFNTFSGKARTKLNINGDANDVTLNIRIKRDQKIWVSITAIAGIEVARALITPDSILLINRLQTLYVKQPFGYVKAYAGNQVNFTTLQSLLLGNVMPELINDSVTIQTSNAATQMTGTLQGLVYKLILGPDLKATQTDLNDQSAGQSLTVKNSVFIQQSNRILPSQIDMSSVAKDKKIQVNLHYVKVDFDQVQDYPFSIPSRYSPAN